MPRPRYVCVTADSRGQVVAVEDHRQGPLLAVTREGRLYVCRQCGLIYWQPLAKSESVDDGQCCGVTSKGRRCRLDALPGGHYCGHHRHLETQNRLVLAELP